MLRLALVAFLCLPIASAIAGPDDDKRAAANSKLKRADRIAACTRLIDNQDLNPLERAQAYLQRGILHRWDDQDEQAIADFDACLKLDAGNPQAHKNRGMVLFNTKKYVQAEAEFGEAAKNEPRNAEHFYYRGRARVALKKYEDAIEDYSRALVFKPRYFSAYTGRARAHRRMKNEAAAVADCNAALSLNPYVADAYYVRGRANEELKKNEEAIFDYAVALALDPNIDGPEHGLKRLGAENKSIEAGPAIEFAPPEEGLNITYLMTQRKAVKLSEADEFMKDLVGWFKKKRVPVPTKKLFLSRQMHSTENSITSATITHRFEESDGKVEKAGRYRNSLWTAIIHGPGMEFDINLEEQPINSLWPLAPGKQASGVGKLEFVAPNPITPQAQFLGAEKPGDRVGMGGTDWKGGVVGWEKVVTPAGVFDAVKLQFDDNVEFNLFGRKKKAFSKLTVWYAPSVRWWVKRTREADGIIQTDEAAFIE